MTNYDHVADLVSKVRNARYGEMVTYLEELIESADWRDFTPPIGYRYQFGACEFDYFLVTQEIDLTFVRHAYAQALDIRDLHRRQKRLANITGAGKKTTPAQRRTWQEMAKALEGEPTGSAGRIRRAFDQKNPPKVVTEVVARRAAGNRPMGKAAGQKQWSVRWSDDRSMAEAIVDKLLTDQVLTHDVYKRLDSARNSREYKQRKRRLQA